MRIAVLSGKGGTGKTFVSVNLSCAADQATTYVDCDVEEPNGHLFLKPAQLEKSGVTVAVPVVDNQKCTGCRTCVNFCKYNAIAFIKEKPLIFYEICHSCGGCRLFCPEQAISEKQREIGFIEKGKSDQVTVLTGNLNIGEVSGVPIIKELIKNFPETGSTVIDCPPGSGCTVMESIQLADFCVLVAEPTLFGVHNLSMVYDLVKKFHKPFGVVLNKCMPESNPAEQFCIDHQIKILAKIPYDEQLGRLNSKGLVAVRENKTYQEIFHNLLKDIEKEAVL